ncbi:SCO3933 family regulatory protein [Mycolicibacter icosiumassiliensis]|uniref:SCO3933 family regulatory protein n=1 Tax=Mycolicibacter icosiumassiliensis TaxID=1792835 RepID=UPI0008322410|nr:hypothetical protein [Mycolicibacter icosiumassiliensis]
MRLLIDTRQMQFTVTKNAEPRVTHDTGAQRTDRQTGEPLFSVQLLVLDDTGGEVIAVTVAGPPKVTVGAAVAVTDLIAIPWQQGDRSGVAYRAASITSTAASATKPGSNS